MNRRRFIRIAATGIAGLSFSETLRAQRGLALKEYSWNGFLLGAEGQFRLFSDDSHKAQASIEHCFAEIRRLEKIFSLYDSSSSISELNRGGQLASPPSELISILQAADQAYRSTGGSFDPTVQPLWKLYSKHFAQNPSAQVGPSAEAIKKTLSRVGWSQVSVESGAIRFQQAGMAITLNGIAQGFITDRISEILQSEGYENVLVELGETRAVGPKPSGDPWRIGIVEAKKQSSLFERIELNNTALATSGGYGSPFEESGRYHHLLDPRTGKPSHYCTAVSVIADTATEADALSTGLCLMAPAQIRDFAASRDDLRVIIQS
ncbi:MAG: FAD:protein FMN transferase [Verrucomicrobiota bacterium]